ncbi:hypothetical protein CALVIDRAFT_538439 [Calocera viscosa TUFC12733]|uniref:Uncharacterized protein n=1 Tax=Calocera viscosa (strain TUFC12733) TaxID=1330018 RepID=A0A167KSA8_CALVF|nr:hypothetical protein CALVIDRAFT_538439 [Calocera viscosa TUFC12733]
MSAPHPPLARTISAPYAQGEYPHPAHDLPPLPHPPPSGSGYSYAPQQEQNSYLSPSTPSLRPRMSYTNLAQHPPSASYDPYADPSRPQQPGLPHSSSSPAYMHYPPHQPQPHPQAHTPLSPPPTANYHHPLYTPQDMRTDLPPAPPPRPTLPSPPLSSDPWTNPAPAYQHPDTSLASRPAPPLPFAPPLPPKPAFYEQEHNPSSSSGGWTVATPGLTRDSAALSDLMERESVASGDTLPPFSDSLPPGYSLSNALAAAARSAQEPAKAPEAQEQQKKGKLPARLLPDPRLVEQEARDRELALRLAQEDVPGGGLVRRDTREWEGFDEVAHAGVGEKGKGVGGEEDEDEDEEREEREARRRREQEEADRAFALELQRQVNGLPSPVDSPRAEEVPLGDEGAQEGADDAEEADRRRAQEEEALGQRMLEQRQRQEEEDAALARRLMEEMRAQAEREEERRRREREAGDAEVARRLAAGGEEPVDAERGKQEQADEDLARRLDEEAREAEVRIERSRRAHEKDLPTPAEEVETTPTQTRFSPAVRPQPPAPTPAPTQGQAQAQGSQLSPPLPSPSKSTRDRSPAREIPELDDDGWQVYDLRSFDGSAGEGSGTRPAGAGTGVDAGQQGSRHTEVWIRPGVQQPQHRPQDIPPASQLSPPTAGPSPARLALAIGFNAPASDTLFHHRKLEPIIFPDLVLLETASPMFISAPTYRALLRALAHFGSVRVEAPPALVASVKTVVQTNAVVQFSRPNQQSKQWRCILHLEVHPSQQDGQQQGRGRPASRIPARTNTLNTVVPLPQPSPALPFTMSSLADYLRKALSDSRSATSDQGKTLHRAVVQSDPEEAAKSASAEPGRQGLLSVLGIGRNNKRTDLNEDTYDLVTPFILSDT